MYKVVWDIETGGVLLVNSSQNVIVPPRPVFYEELDLLGFNRFWDYPHVEEPLLWSIGRRYYYLGKCVAEVRGGGFFEKPKIILKDEGKNLSLEPVDVKSMIEKNLSALEVLENEAIDFVQETFKKYKEKVDYVVVSYSGGKDSQVLLDLVSKTLPPDEYIVIFSDTTMEIPTTYETYEKTKEYYTKLYPSLKFYVARNEQHSFKLWRIFGPPSRIIRWCCSVYKTSPQVRLLKALSPEKDEIKFLVFDGVRADESPRRSTYERVAENVKHFSQINAEVIKYWNLTEVYLYLYKNNIRDSENKLLINKGYRYGLGRIGCSVCPFGSSWSEFIISQVFPEVIKEYLKIINEHVQYLGIEFEEDIKKYIEEGQWKKRAGGEGVERDGIWIEILENNNKLKAVIANPRENITEWLKILGSINCKKSKNKNFYELNFNQKTFYLYISEIDGKLIIESVNEISDKDFISKFRKILYKSTYCIHCGVCEAECFSRALKVFPKVKIDQSKCKHCFKCLDFIEKGCMLAKSVDRMVGKMNKKNLSGFGRYLTFGMREEWLNQFLKHLDEWYSKNNLGPKQFESMKAWLKDAELIDSKKLPTSLAQALSKLISKDENFVYQIIWINLFYNSSVVKWYLQNINWGSYLSAKDIYEVLINQEHLYPKTASSGLKSLLDMFENTYIYNKLGLGIVEKKGRERYIRKVGTNEVHPIAVLYSLYRYAISKNKYKFTVSELYNLENKDGGPYLIFGIERSVLENILRWLEENRRDLIKVDLIVDLDNISLYEDIKDYSQILEYYK